MLVKRILIGYLALKGLNVTAQGETLGNGNKNKMNPEGVSFQEWSFLLMEVAPFQGACFVRFLPRVTPWAVTFRPCGADGRELMFL